MDEKESSRLKQFEATIRRRVEFEQKSFHVVNKLIEGKVEDDYLVQCVRFINKEHYNDITEERAISSLCGYPLCDKALPRVPKKKYQISTKSNKVFDISERKNFCSSQCFKASDAFCQQISDSPVWAREMEPHVEINLVPHVSSRGKVGVEVIGISPRKQLQAEVEELQKLDGTANVSSASVPSPTVPAQPVQKRFSVSASKDERSGSKNREANGNIKSDAVSSKQSSTWEDRSTMVKREVKETKESELVTKVKALTLKDSPKTPEKEGSIPENAQTTAFVSDIRDQQTSTLNTPEFHSTKKDASSDSLKLDLLKKLLEKNKNVLSQMIDVQEKVTKEPGVKTAEAGDGNSQSESVSRKVELVAIDHDNKVEQRQNAIDTLPQDKSASNSQLSGDSEAVINFLSTSDSDQAEKLSSQNIFNRQHKRRTPLFHIAQIMRSWTSETTVTYLKQSDLASSDDFPKNFSHPEVQRRYTDLCKRFENEEIELNEVVDVDEIDPKKTKTRLKNAPDYKLLQEESEEFQLKVTEFITGKRQKPKTKSKEKPEEDAVYLPTVDSQNQMHIRVKIFLDRLDKALPDVLEPLRLAVQDVSTLIRALAYTFRLDKDNIVLKPPEWTLVSLCLLKILALKSRAIEEAFQSESVSRYFTVVLKGIGHSLDDLDSLVDYVLSEPLPAKQMANP